MTMDSVSFPECDVVLSIGECLNYEFADQITNLKIKNLFSRVYHALSPQGMFIFDVLCEGEPKELVTKDFIEGNGWLVAVERTETFDKLSRKIISFREMENGHFRKTTEIHTIHKYDTDLITHTLQEIGFSVKMMDAYGDFKLRNGHKVFVSKKL